MLDILLADRACPENYRIKPEEPKFKVGDWVVNKTSLEVAKAFDKYVLDNSLEHNTNDSLGTLPTKLRN